MEKLFRSQMYQIHILFQWFTISLFIAVSTTKRSTLALIAILANHPQIQEKIHKEIDSVLGNGEPCLADRNEMHYLSAVRYFQIESE